MKKSLANIKKANTQILPLSSDTSSDEKPSTITTEVKKPVSHKKATKPNPVGRPSIDPEEKESETISLKIKPSELAILNEKRGLVPIGTFVKHSLRTETEVFKK